MGYRWYIYKSRSTIGFLGYNQIILLIIFNSETNQAIMSTVNKNRRNKLPHWQSEKMKALIEERWSEIWEIVVARENSTQDLPEHSRRI